MANKKKLKYSYDFWYKIYESLPEAYTKTQNSKEQQDICKGCVMHKFCLDTEYMLCGEIMMGMVYINNKNKIIINDKNENNKRG